MAVIRADAPQAQRGFMELNHALLKQGPRQLAELVRTGQQIKALTVTKRGKR